MDFETIMDFETMSNRSVDRLSPVELPPELVKEASEQLPREDEAAAARASVGELSAHLGTDPSEGLASATAEGRLRAEGRNELLKPAMPSFAVLFCLQLTNFVILLLFVAAVASVAVNATSEDREDLLSYTTGVAIFVLIFINAGIAAKTEAAANGALDALSKLSQAQALVVRDGKEAKVDTNLLVRGDLVIMEVGDVVPADVRLIEASDFKVNEMLLTGEPDDVAKTHRVREVRPGDEEKLVPETMAFSGCLLTNGKGVGLVVQTGMQTRIGKIAAMLQDSKGRKKCGCLPDTSAGRTPLQENVEKLGGRIGVLAIAVCVVVFVIGVCMETLPPTKQESRNRLLDSGVYMILVAVTLAVAAIPEGIPLCVTISLSLGCKAMSEGKVLVRKLAAVETLGSASVICTDKTGTLTEGKMTMVKMWSAGQSYDVSGKGFDPEDGTITRAEGGDGTRDAGVQSSLFAALLCCNATLRRSEDPETGRAVWEPQGNSSEAPIVVAARKAGLDGDAVAERHERLLEVPFSSARKMMLTVSRLGGTTLGEGGASVGGDAEQLVVVCKGAPNFVLDACTSWLSGDGIMEELGAEQRARVLEVVDDFSSQALRVLAVGVRTMPSLPYDASDEELPTDAKFQRCLEGLQFLGLVASIDPERSGVPEAVLTARGASIRVVMITGDYLRTAVAIGRNCNILAADDDDERDALDCGDLRPGGAYLEAAEMDRLTSRVKVFARAQPQDKLEIVRSLQRQGLVSAMTGDGVNDAPALKCADIGIAMGIQGTEVAKGAADMVLMDDNFANIVRAVEKGRVIYAGIQKFVAFIMSVHIAEVIQIFLCIVAGVPVMRSPIQILFLILVTDLPPSIALGMEPGEPGVLKLRPRPKKEPIVLSWMWQSIVVNGVILSAVILGVYVCALDHFLDGAILQEDIARLPREEAAAGVAAAQTVAFISLVFCENCRAYTSRSFDRPFWTKLLANTTMQYAVLLAQIMLFVAVFAPVLSTEVLGLDGTAVELWGWVVALLGALCTLVLCELYKVVTHRQMRSYQSKLKAQREREEQEATAAARRQKPTGAVDALVRKVSDTVLHPVRASSQESVGLKDAEIDLVDQMQP